MIAYFKCLCKSQDKIQAKKLKDLGYEIRVTKYSSDYRSQSAKYNLKLPIVVENGVARQI